jgi:PilZ domain
MSAARNTMGVSMPQADTARAWFTTGGERRRIPRYSCNGVAQITCLPLSGSPLRGRVRDLGLGGCCIECSESVPWLDLGDRTEILLEVNSWFVRAMAHVKAIRGQVALSMQFLRMSAGGSSMLADLIADLQRPRIVEARPACLIEPPPQLLRGSNSSLLSARPEGVAIVGAILPPYSADEIYPATNRDAAIRNLYSANPSVDIFV